MVSWSALGRSFGTILVKNQFKTPIKTQYITFSSTLPAYGHGSKTMALQPSRWQWYKFKDMLHLYMMVGLIPVGLIIFCANVFVGPAQLARLREDDPQPKYWEYHRHPITRFIARYIHNNPQQDYEKFLHFLDEEKQRMKLRELEKKIVAKMAERHDYQAYYYKPLVNKYLRINKQTGEELQARLGDDYEE